MRLTEEMIAHNIARGDWDRSSITAILERNAKSYPDNEAVVDSSKRYTWSQLNRVINGTAIGLLERGIQREQALVAQLPTSCATLILLLACQKAGIEQRHSQSWLVC